MTLAARHVTVHGAGRSRLADVSLTLDPAVPTLVVGPNGAGKTTLIRILVGLQRPHRGEVRWRDATLASLTARERAEAVAWLPQHPRLEEGLTALDVVAAARYRFREPLWQAHDAALDALSRLDAAQWAERPMTTLSGGEAQRVRLAALAAQEASWWLLDEPFNHLDPEVQLGLLEAVQQKHGQGGGVVLVTHGPHAGAPVSFGSADRARCRPDCLRRGRRGARGAATTGSAVPHCGRGGHRPRSHPFRVGEAIGVTRGVWAVLLGTALALVLAPWIGPSLEADTASFVVAQLRIPRVVLGGLVGAALGLTGAAFQIVLENPLATPSTLGTTAGAALGALAVIVLWPAAGPGAPSVALGAFVGAAGVSLGLASLSTLPQLRTEDLLLAGIAITLAAGAAATGLQLQADAAQTLASVRWALGSVSTVGHGKAWALWPWVAVASVVILSQGRALQAMAAGADRAMTQGVHVVRTRTAVLTAGSLAVAGCVASTGPIAFVGLVVPHLIRLAIGGAPRVLLPLSAVAGAGFLPLADGLSRIVVPGRDVPVGVIMAMLGAPALLGLVLFRRR